MNPERFVGWFQTINENDFKMISQNCVHNDMRFVSFDAVNGIMFNQINSPSAGNAIDADANAMHAN